MCTIVICVHIFKSILLAINISFLLNLYINFSIFIFLFVAPLFNLFCKKFALNTILKHIQHSKQFLISSKIFEIYVPYTLRNICKKKNFIRKIFFLMSCYDQGCHKTIWVNFIDNLVKKNLEFRKKTLIFKQKSLKNLVL